MTKEAKIFLKDYIILTAIIAYLLFLIVSIALITFFIYIKKKHNMQSDDLKFDINTDLTAMNNKLKTSYQEGGVNKINSFSGYRVGDTHHSLKIKSQNNEEKSNIGLERERHPMYSELENNKIEGDVFILNKKEHDFKKLQEINDVDVNLPSILYIEDTDFSKRKAKSSPTVSSQYGTLSKVRSYKDRGLVQSISIKNKISNINITDDLGNTVFHDHAKYGIYEGNIDRLFNEAVLLRSREQVDLLNKKNGNLDVPLHLAIIHKTNNYAQFIINLMIHGADVNIGNRDKEGCLHLAIRHNEGVDLIGLFIDNDADFNKKNKDGDSPLNLAIQMINFEAAKLLIEKGADVSSQNNDGNTSLHLLIKVVIGYENNYNKELQYDELIGSFLQNKEIFNIKNKDDDVPLHIATKGKDYRIAQFLIDNKCNINERDKSGNTPLHIAIRVGDISISDLLIKNNADVSLKNNDLDTALHLSVRGKYFIITKDIIESGCDINAKNNKGETSLDIADENKDSILSGFLIENGGVQGKLIKETIIYEKRPKLVKSFIKQDEEGTKLALNSIKSDDNECC